MALTIQTAVGAIEVTDSDLGGVFRLNPLALEQLKGIVLERALVEATQKLSDATQTDEGEVACTSI